MTNQIMTVKIKRLVIFTLFTIVFGTVWADNAADARKILDRTAATVGRKGGATAAFTISGANMPKQSGVLHIKGRKFCASTPSATMWFDGKTQWTYVKSTNEVNIAAPSTQSQQMMNPYTFIYMYKSGFKLSVKKQGSTNVVRMVAQKKGASIPEMYITVNGKYYPTQVRIKQKNKWTTIDIRNFQAKDQADRYFVFPSKDYPTAEIVDLR